MNLLIVDDSLEMRLEIIDLVANIAYQIHECANGTDAVAAYAQHKPDWVLMDIMMQGGDGIEATRQIVARWPDAKVVIVTSYDDADLKAAAKAAGATDYVSKENLLDVRRVLLAETHQANSKA